MIFIEEVNAMNCALKKYPFPPPPPPPPPQKKKKKKERKKGR